MYIMIPVQGGLFFLLSDVVYPKGVGVGVGIKEKLFKMFSNVLDIRRAPPTMGIFFGFWGNKAWLWVHHEVKININSSSQYIQLQYKG